MYSCKQLCHYDLAYKITSVSYIHLPIKAPIKTKLCIIPYPERSNSSSLLNFELEALITPTSILNKSDVIIVTMDMKFDTPCFKSS